MKSWNTHAWYISGILLALLIGTLSVRWNEIPNLAGIISFALGLSSLILAIIAIVQSLTGGADVVTTLSHVRSASDDLKAATDELKGFAGQVSGVGSRMAESQSQLVQILSSQTDQKGDGNVGPTSQTEAGTLNIDRLPLGGAEAVYAAAWAVQTKKPFNMGLFVDEQNDWTSVAFDDGFLSALIRMGVIEGSFSGSLAVVTNLGIDPSNAREQIKQFSFTSPGQERFQARLERIDSYFQR